MHFKEKLQTQSLRTQLYLLDTAVSLKKGDFNTPSVSLFFKTENGGFDCYFKTATITDKNDLLITSSGLIIKPCSIKTVPKRKSRQPHL